MLFIDTGAFIAKYHSRDNYHQKTLDMWNKIQQYRLRCFTSNFILDETITLLGRRLNYHFAAERAKIFYMSKAFTILRPTLEEEVAALRFFEKYIDQKISFTDCISFVLMKKYKISQVFSFDKHFQHAGFTIFE